MSLLISSSSRRPLLPSILTPLLLFSIALSGAVLGLSVVNFGLLSRWYNATAGIFAIISHLVVFVLAWRERRASEPAMAAIITPTTSSFPPSAQAPRATIKIELLPDSETNPSTDFPVAHTVATILNLGFLVMLYLIAFGIMADITRRGGKASTLPQEREKGMTFPWNIKVQIAQTALVGVETLVLIVALVISCFGRMRIAEKKEGSLEEVEYGLRSASLDDGDFKGRPF